jgi:hypothetical protein
LHYQKNSYTKPGIKEVMMFTFHRSAIDKAVEDLSDAERRNFLMDFSTFEQELHAADAKQAQSLFPSEFVMDITRMVMTQARDNAEPGTAWSNTPDLHDDARITMVKAFSSVVMTSCYKVVALKTLEADVARQADFEPS